MKFWRKEPMAGGIAFTFTAKPVLDVGTLGLATGGPFTRPPKKKAHSDKAAPSMNKRLKLKRLMTSMPSKGAEAREKFTASRQ